MSEQKTLTGSAATACYTFFCEVDEREKADEHIREELKAFYLELPWKPGIGEEIQLDFEERLLVFEVVSVRTGGRIHGVAGQDFNQHELRLSWVDCV